MVLHTSPHLLHPISLNLLLILILLQQKPKQTQRTSNPFNLTHVMLQQTQLWRFRELCITPLDPLWWQSKSTHSPLHPWELALCKLTPLSILIPRFPRAAHPAPATNAAAALQNSWAQDFPEVLLGLMHNPFTTTGSCWTQLLQDLHCLKNFLPNSPWILRDCKSSLLPELEGKIFLKSPYLDNSFQQVIQHIYIIKVLNFSTFLSDPYTQIWLIPLVVFLNLANSSCEWFPIVAYLNLANSSCGWLPDKCGFLKFG
jgi:hypothetical protein